MTTAAAEGTGVLRSKTAGQDGGVFAGTPTPLDDDISPRAGHDSLDLSLFGLGYSELIERFLEIVHKGVPLFRGDHEMLMRVLHRTAGKLLRTASRPAKHFRDEVFEAWRRNTMVGLVYPWVCIQARINHDPVDEIIHHRRDAVDAITTLFSA